jgi:WD40 repeat protein
VGRLPAIDRQKKTAVEQLATDLTRPKTKESPQAAERPSALADARSLLAQVADDDVRGRLQRVLALWDLGYLREALSQFRLFAEQALTRLIDHAPPSSERKKRSDQLERGQAAKVVEWLYRDAMLIPARVALHLHTLLGWGSYASHHQAREHSAQLRDLTVLLSIAIDLEDFIVSELEGGQSILTDAHERELEAVLDHAMRSRLPRKAARAFAERTEAIECVSSGLRSQRLGLELHGHLPAEEDQPAVVGYRGLQSFDVSDADQFFGRQDTIDKLLAAREQSDLLLLCGASGAGKTSLLRAGLTPRLLASRQKVLLIWEYSAESLSAAIAVLGHWPTAEPINLIFDQLERGLLADVPPDVRQLLVTLILVVERLPGVRAVLGLREDFLGRLLRDAERVDAQAAFALHQKDAYIALGGLSEKQAREAIERPLDRTAIRWDETLVRKRLVPQLCADPSSTTVNLQLICGTLLDEARHRRLSVIDDALFMRLGGASRILEGHLERTLGGARYQTDRDLARAALKAMCGHEARQWVDYGGLWQSLNARGHACDEVELRAVLSRLTEDRLIVARAEGPRTAASFSLMHDLLAGAVKKWRSPAELERERAQDTLDRSLERYVDPAQQEPLMGRSLKLVEQHWPHLEKRDAKLAQRLLAASRRQRRRRRTALVSLIVLAVVGVSFGAQQLQRAISERDRAKNAAQRGFVLQALLALDRDPSMALAWLRHLARRRGGVGVRALLDEARRRGVARVLAGHQGLVTSVDFAPDQKTVLTAGRDGTLRLWDRRSLAQRGRPIRGHTGYVTRAIFSPDGKLIASAGWDRTIRLWDRATKKAVGKPLSAHRDWVYDIAFSPDGRFLASASFDGDVRLWPLQGPRKRQSLTLSGHEKGVMSVAFSPDGKTLASASLDRSIRLWDAALLMVQAGQPKETAAASQPQSRVLRGHRRGVYALSFSPDGSTLASASLDTTIRFWRREDGAPLGAPLSLHGAGVIALAYSPDGKTLASAGEDKQIVLWDVQKRRRRGTALLGHAGFVRALAYSKDGRVLASASRDETVRLWQLTHRRARGATLGGHKGPIHQVAYSPRGDLLVSADRDGFLHFWDPARRVHRFAPQQAHRDVVFGLLFSQDGKSLLSGGRDGRLIHWQLSDRASPRRFMTQSKQWGGIYALAVTPDGKTAISGGGDGTLQRWSLEAGKPPRPLDEATNAHSSPVFAMALSVDGQLLASAGRDGRILLHDARKMERRGDIAGHKKAVYSLAFSGDGSRLASASGDGHVMIWDVKSRSLLLPPLSGHRRWVLSVAFSPDGKLLASGGSDGSVRFWRAQNGRALGVPLYAHQDWVYSLAFSPDGRLLATGSGDRTLGLFSIAGFDRSALEKRIDRLTNLHVARDGRAYLTR